MPVELDSDILLKVDSGHLKELSLKQLNALYMKLHKEYQEAVEDEDELEEEEPKE